MDHLLFAAEQYAAAQATAAAAAQYYASAAMNAAAGNLFAICNVVNVKWVSQ